jgi:hypothetical protein
MLEDSYLIVAQSKPGVAWYPLHLVFFTNQLPPTAEQLRGVFFQQTGVEAPDLGQGWDLKPQGKQWASSQWEATAYAASHLPAYYPAPRQRVVVLRLTRDQLADAGIYVDEVDDVTLIAMAHALADPTYTLLLDHMPGLIKQFKLPRLGDNPPEDIRRLIDGDAPTAQLINALGEIVSEGCSHRGTDEAWHLLQGQHHALSHLFPDLADGCTKDRVAAVLEAMQSIGEPFVQTPATTPTPA